MNRTERRIFRPTIWAFVAGVLIFGLPVGLATDSQWWTWLAGVAGGVTFGLVAVSREKL